MQWLMLDLFPQALALASISRSYVDMEGICQRGIKSASTTKLQDALSCLPRQMHHEIMPERSWETFDVTKIA